MSREAGDNPDYGPLTLNGWHIINGKWAHITQCTKNNHRAYFTNGILQGTSYLDSNGYATPGSKDTFWAGKKASVKSRWWVFCYEKGTTLDLWRVTGFKTREHARKYLAVVNAQANNELYSGTEHSRIYHGQFGQVWMQVVDEQTNTKKGSK